METSTTFLRRGARRVSGGNRRKSHCTTRGKLCEDDTFSRVSKRVREFQGSRDTSFQKKEMMEMSSSRARARAKGVFLVKFINMIKDFGMVIQVGFHEVKRI